jgi:predicted acetylornithine/succinylornithine family transaminase
MKTIINPQNLAELDAAFILGTYPRASLVFERGEGLWLYDHTGKRYLDFTSGISVNNLGHAHPEIVAAISDQAARLGHVSNLYLTESQVLLAQRLCELSFADKVYFCNSGTEAVEAAIKFARKYARQSYGEKKTRFLAFHGGFHGRTMGALALTAREKYQAPFRPLMPDVDYAPLNDLEAAARLITAETCAVIVEPLQGEGGVYEAELEFLRHLRRLCDQVGALLIVDEIQCGLGRTGILWAYEAAGITPDMMTLAKALGGGLPIGAVLLASKVAAVMEVGDHGSTFAGGPVVCQAARVVLEHVSAPEMLAHISRMGAYLMSGLEAAGLRGVGEVRGRGLMVGVQLEEEARPISGGRVCPRRADVECWTGRTAPAASVYCH